MTGKTRRVRALRRLEQCRKRLDKYLAREEEILSGGVQSYGVGDRSLARYQADLAVVRAAIDELTDEIDGLEAVAEGRSARGAFAIVPRDL